MRELFLALYNIMLEGYTVKGIHLWPSRIRVSDGWVISNGAAQRFMNVGDKG